MKNPVITGLAVAGVVAAGTASAAVNTSIFDSQAEPAPPSAALMQPAATTSVPPAAVEPIIVQAAVQAPDSAPTTTAAATMTAVSYSLGDSGAVTLDVVGGALTIVETSANSGWDVVDMHSDGTMATVTFEDAETRIVFTAGLADGEIETSVAATAIGGYAETSPTYSSDDEYEEEEDEDEHEEYEDD